MDLRSGTPLWLAEPAADPPESDLDGPLDCDVAVIGAGITGALTAWQLARDGCDVVVLDRREAGKGSTAASTALIEYELDTPLVELRRSVGRARADRAYLAAADGVRRIRQIVRESGAVCGYEELPSVYLASGAAGAEALPAECAARRELGLAVTTLSPADIANRFPFSRPAALCSDHGAQLDPVRLTAHLLRSAAAGGARIRTGVGAAVSAIQRGDRLKLAAGGGMVTARRAVLATGYESQAYLEASVASLKSTYVIATSPGQPLEHWADRCLLWETARPYLYLRTTPDARVIVGGEDEPFADAERRDALIPGKAALLAERAGRLFPDIDFTPAFAWAGTFAETSTGLPCITRLPAMPEVWLALGYGGNGITFGAVAADIICSAIGGRRHEAEGLFPLPG